MTKDKQPSERQLHSDNLEQCPFCDMIFDVSFLKLKGTDSEFESHVKTVHKKIRIRKGTNYKWMDVEEVKKLIANPTSY